MEKKDSNIRLPVSLIFLKLIDIDDIDTMMAVANVSHITYSHLSKLKKLYRKYDMITEEKKGRKKILKLTEKGKKVVTGLEMIMEGFQLYIQDYMPGKFSDREIREPIRFSDKDVNEEKDLEMEEWLKESEDDEIVNN